MADPTYVIPEIPIYDPVIRALQDSDPARASTVFNPVLEKMIVNTHAVKLAGDDLAKSVEALEEAASKPGDASGIMLPDGTTVTEAIGDLETNKAGLKSPAFTGEPKAPTPAAASNNTQIATTAFVKEAVGPLGGAYEGADLTHRYAAEIAATSGADSETKKWNWIKARVQAKNFTGIYVGDYIPFTLTDGKQFKAEVSGIDTYYNYGDIPVGHHIDFITRDCHPDTHVWNKVNYNNGTTVSPSPWLACDLYAWLNSKKMNVPNAITANPALIEVDYTATGVLNKLPPALVAVIVEKRLLIPHRYTPGELLLEDNSWSWQNVGKLWVPFEFEVYGCNVWGSNVSPNQGWSIGGFVQYPIFSCNMKRVKGAGDGGARAYWWLASVSGGYSTSAAIVSHYGFANNTSASYTGVRAPLCFRVS